MDELAKLNVVCVRCGWRFGAHTSWADKSRCPNGMVFKPSILTATMEEERANGPRTEPLFRIGRFYRQKNGALRKLGPPVPTWENKEGRCQALLVDSGLLWIGDGMRRLFDGAYIPQVGNPDDPNHLVPGEMDERGRPLDAEAQYLASCEGAEGKVTPTAPRRSILEGIADEALERAVTRMREEPEPDMPEDPSAKRDRSHVWAAPSRTPFDSFGKDFIVERETEPQPPEPQHPLQRSTPNKWERK